MLSERSRIQKITLHDKSIVVENRLVIAMGQAVECWWRRRGTSGDDIVVLYLDCGVCYMTACIFQNSLNYPLKISEFYCM